MEKSVATLLGGREFYLNFRFVRQLLGPSVAGKDSPEPSRVVSAYSLSRAK